MKKQILLITLFSLSFYLGMAQMPGMGSNNGAMNSMNNLPQGTSNNGASKKDEPPHGGELKEVGKFFIEVFFDEFSTDEKLSVWVLKSNFKPAKIETITGGKARIRYAKSDAKEEEVALVLFDDRFVCNVQDASQAFTAFITITIKDKEYQVVYNHKAIK